MSGDGLTQLSSALHGRFVVHIPPPGRRGAGDMQAQRRPLGALPGESARRPTATLQVGSDLRASRPYGCVRGLPKRRRCRGAVPDTRGADRPDPVRGRFCVHYAIRRHRCPRDVHGVPCSRHGEGMQPACQQHGQGLCLPGRPGRKRVRGYLHMPQPIGRAGRRSPSTSFLTEASVASICAGRHTSLTT